MKKIIFCIAVLFVQGLTAQITLIPFTPDIPFSSFAGTLDIYGNEIVSSANYSHDFTQSRVFVFEKTGSTITPETYFTPSDVAFSDNFGETVSIDNDFIAASSRLNDQVASNAGAVYMYRKIAGIWTFFQKIIPFDGVADDYFGTDIKVVGNQLFVSSVNNEAVGQPTSTNSGAVYVYKFNGVTWNFLQKLTVSGSHSFGIKLRSQNNKLVVASNSSFGTGTLHTYDYDGTNWNFSSSFSPVDPSNYTIYDFNLENNQLYVLPQVAYPNAQMYIYDAGVSSWNLSTTLSSLNLNDKYPANFKVHNDVMFISLNNHPLLYTARTPTAIYRKISGVWTYQEMIYGQGEIDRDDFFGMEIAMSDDFVVIGAPGEFFGAAGGRAYTFDVALSLGENTGEDLKVYPNPASEMLYLSDNLAGEISFIEVYQTDGKLIRKIQSGFDSVSLSGVQNGVYLFKFTMSNGSSITRKIVKI
jgi:hypothetical protein